MHHHSPSHQDCCWQQLQSLLLLLYKPIRTPTPRPPSPNPGNPIIVRLAWHDAGTYDKSIKEWPQRGGANAAIRLAPEMSHGHNAGGCA